MHVFSRVHWEQSGKSDSNQETVHLFFLQTNYNFEIATGISCCHASSANNPVANYARDIITLTFLFPRRDARLLVNNVLEVL